MLIVKVDAADKSSVTEYMISVYKPSDKDTSLRSLQVDRGLLVEPKFMPSEMNYSVRAFQNDILTLTPIPMNPKAEVIVSPSSVPISLNLGNTIVSIVVATADCKSEYKVLISRDSPAIRLSCIDLPQLKCMICRGLTFKPHRFKSHTVCGACAHNFNLRQSTEIFDLEEEYYKAKQVSNCS